MVPQRPGHGAGEMRRVPGAALAYFAPVFAAGFALGTLRVLLLAPALGGVAAVALELPVMLALAWVAARWAAERFEVPAAAAPRLAMGGLAFVLLIAAEAALGIWGFGRGGTEIVAGFVTAEGILGLAGQVAFAFVPLVQGGLR